MEEGDTSITCNTVFMYIYSIISEANIATELTASKFWATPLTNRSNFMKNKGLGGRPDRAIIAKVTINPVKELLSPDKLEC